jgi:DNA polymerase-1
MWLPHALFIHYHDQKELQKYLGDRDYAGLATVVHNYLKDDCVNTFDLAVGMLQELKEQHGKQMDSLLSMNRNICNVVWKMETRGIGINSDDLQRGISSCDTVMSQCFNKCKRIAEEDVDNFTPAILRRILFEKFELEPVSYTAKTREPQVAAKALVELLKQNPTGDVSDFLINLMAFSKIEKKKQFLVSYNRTKISTSNIKRPVPEGGAKVRLFPSLKRTGTGTTRFSSSDPNVQQWEKAGNTFEDKYGPMFAPVDKLLVDACKVRSLYGPGKDKWWFAADYSQLQLRIFAQATGEPEMIQSFLDGHDFHDFIARVIFELPDTVAPTSEQRRIGKNCNFGFIFGASEKKIDETCGRHGVYSFLMASFPHAHNFIKETKALIRDTGTVYTLGGYPLKIPMSLNEWTGRMSYAAHAGVNYIIQGTEGEIAKRAMEYTDAYLENEMEDARLILPIHDELVFETKVEPDKEDIRNLKKLMENAGKDYGVHTPVDVELCKYNLSRKTKVHL